MKYYIMAWRKYIKFHGRASRSEYWYFTFINIAISIALHLAGVRAGMTEMTIFQFGGEGSVFPEVVFKQTVLDLVYFFAVLLPLITVGVRRMQDIGRTGWILFVPIYGQYLCCLDGHEEDNKNGPKARA